MKINFIIFILFGLHNLYSIDFNTLKEYTIKNSYELKISKLDIEISNEKINIINSEYYPQLSFGFNMENSNSLSDSSTNTYIDSTSISNEDIQKSYSSLSLNYGIYSFGRTNAKKEVEEYSNDSLKYTYCKKKNELLNKLLDYYYKSLKYQIKNTIFKQILKKRNKIYTANKRLFEIGNINKIKLMENSIEIANLFSEMTNNQKLLFNSLEKLSEISKYKIEKNIHLENLKISPLKKAQTTFDKTSDAKVLKYKIKSKQSEINLIKKDYLPTINLYSKYDIYGSDENSFNRSFNNMESNSFKIGFSFSWNLFNGFKTSASKKKAILELNKLNEQYKQEKEKFNIKMAVANKNYILEKKILNHKKESLNLSKENYINSNRLNRIGEMSKMEELKLNIKQLYNQIEYLEAKEKVAYQAMKKNLLLNKGTKCIVH